MFVCAQASAGGGKVSFDDALLVLSGCDLSTKVEHVSIKEQLLWHVNACDDPECETCEQLQAMIALWKQQKAAYVLASRFCTTRLAPL